MELCPENLSYLKPWCTLCRRYLRPWYYCTNWEPIELQNMCYISDVLFRNKVLCLRGCTEISKISLENLCDVYIFFVLLDFTKPTPFDTPDDVHTAGLDILCEHTQNKFSARLRGLRQIQNYAQKVLVEVHPLVRGKSYFLFWRVILKKWTKYTLFFARQSWMRLVESSNT